MPSSRRDGPLSGAEPRAAHFCFGSKFPVDRPLSGAGRTGGSSRWKATKTPVRAATRRSENPR